ncbi:MAG: hypothetical protein IJX89_04030 [Alphaproteobacteria bacterium]|nr:hypothetical protein [Alphaproteobacteria bacterium]
MKKISHIAIMLAAIGPIAAHSAYSDDAFRAEVLEGLDLIGARATIDEVPERAPGELGLEVYEIADAVNTDAMKVYVPTSMYMRMGGGLFLGFAMDKAEFNGREYESSGSYSTQIGLGWNLSSYVRTEIDFHESVLEFSDLDDHQATYQEIGSMLYFDLARRYVQTGDITRRRTFVPFMGFGVSVGAYEFEGANGADGMFIAAPRAVLGFNVMFNDLIGLDIAYQYQMIIGNGYGWGVRAGGVDNFSSIMASLRVNF